MMVRRQNAFLLATALAVLSMAAAWLVWKSWVSPVDTRALQPIDGPDWFGASLLLPLVAPVAFALVLRRASVITCFAAFALAPLLMAGVSYSLKDERAWQSDARGVYRVYAGHFPRSRIGSPSVMDQTDRYLTVCADEGARYHRFCLEVNLTLTPGRQVVGGYRLNQLTTDPKPQSCFGEPIACS